MLSQVFLVQELTVNITDGLFYYTVVAMELLNRILLLHFWEVRILPFSLFHVENSLQLWILSELLKFVNQHTINLVYLRAVKKMVENRNI